MTHSASSKGSFEETVQGIRNILDSGMDLFINSVITSKNYIHLGEIADLLIDLGVKNSKFGTLVDAGHCKKMVPNNSLVRPYLSKALEKYKNAGVKFSLEKSALCLSPNYINACIYEPDSYLYTKSSVCENCDLGDLCVGLPVEQLSLYGDVVASPIKNNSKRLKFNEILVGDNHHFVKWDDLTNMSITAIVKLTAMCNLDCQYCYAKRNFNNSNMPLKTAKKIMSNLSDTGFGRVDINFHGGEPLLYGKDNIKEIIHFGKEQLKSKTKIFRLQTNGVLLDKAWSGFFADNEVELGVSLDGPQNVHDANRVFVGQKGSHKRIHNNFNQIKDTDAKLEILCVLTPSSTGKAEEIFNYFRDLSVKYPDRISSVNFSPSFEVKNDSGELIESTIQPDDYSDLMLRLFELWFDSDGEYFDVPFFSEVISTFLGGKPSMCQLKRGCLQFVTIEPDGSVYPCDRFSGLSEFRLGSIHTNSVVDILSSAEYQKYVNLVFNHNKKCKGCEWFNVCNGGCLYESYAQTKRSGEISFYCIALKKIFSHIDETLKNSVEGYCRYSPVN